MTQEEYNNRTRCAVSFLAQVFAGDVTCLASIMTTQAEQDTGKLVLMLSLIKDFCDREIEELKKL